MYKIGKINFRKDEVFLILKRMSDVFTLKRGKKNHFATTLASFIYRLYLFCHHYLRLSLPRSICAWLVGRNQGHFSKHDF